MLCRSASATMLFSVVLVFLRSSVIRADYESDAALVPAAPAGIDALFATWLLEWPEPPRKSVPVVLTIFEDQPEDPEDVQLVAQLTTDRVRRLVLEYEPLTSEWDISVGLPREISATRNPEFRAFDRAIVKRLKRVDTVEINERKLILSDSEGGSDECRFKRVSDAASLDEQAPAMRRLGKVKRRGSMKGLGLGVVDAEFKPRGAQAPRFYGQNAAGKKRRANQRRQTQLSQGGVRAGRRRINQFVGEGEEYLFEKRKPLAKRSRQEGLFADRPRRRDRGAIAVPAERSLRSRETERMDAYNNAVLRPLLAIEERLQSNKRGKTREAVRAPSRRLADVDYDETQDMWDEESCEEMSEGREFESSIEDN